MFFLVLMQAGTQNDTLWKNELNEKLDSDQKTEYLHLVGYFNNYFFSEMKVAFDDQFWVGMFSIPDQDLSYYLEGGMVNGKILLMEYDNDEQLIGYWSLAKEQEKYLCKWSNIANSMDFEMEMFDALWFSQSFKSRDDGLAYFQR